MCVSLSSGGKKLKTSAVPLPRGHRTSRENQNMHGGYSALVGSSPVREAESPWTHVLILLCFQVALEVIEELCYEMGLHKLEAMEEYAIFLVTNRGELPTHKLTRTLCLCHKQVFSRLSAKQIHSWITYQTVLWFPALGESYSWS